MCLEHAQLDGLEGVHRHEGHDGAVERVVEEGDERDKDKSSVDPPSVEASLRRRTRRGDSPVLLGSSIAEDGLHDT